MEYYISTYNYLGSTLGNACFSVRTIKELFSCVLLSNNVQELDAAVSASIALNEIQNISRNVQKLQANGA
jgi:hypothetical protein